ncbi:MAG: helix-turn-helix transcriptional regulator [Myxococcales bacterium]
MSSALALQRFPFLHTRSLELVEQLQSGMHGRTVLERTDPKLAFEWQANRLVVGELAVTASRYGGGLRAKTDNVDRIYTLLIPQHGGGQSTQGREATLLRPGRMAAVVSASLPATVEVDSYYQGFGVRIAADVMERTLHALTGVQRVTPLCFEGSVDLQQGAGAELMRLLQFILDGAKHEHSVLRTPIIEARLSEAFVVALLLGVRHNHSHLLRTEPRAIESRHVKLAQEYMEANAHRAITAAEVAQATGLTIRALNAAFQAHGGVPPFGFLRERRLALARARLASSSAATVAEVALSSGFPHLGRFSVQYKKRYGESPVETLRRARKLQGP